MRFAKSSSKQNHDYPPGLVAPQAGSRAAGEDETAVGNARYLI
jgi:hypothetical protein